MRTTKLLLLAGAVAGPLYLVAGLLQALTRPGFDITRDDLSELSLGALGWMQTANFILTGALTVAGAVGVSRALGGGPGGRWVPRLIAVYGIALICAGLFRADPVPGFPPGTTQAVISWHGLLHLLFASIGFLALVAAMFVLGRVWMKRNDRAWAIYSIVSGAVFLFCFLGAIIGGNGENVSVSVLGLWIAVIAGWLWLTLTESRLIVAQSAASTAAPP